MDGEPKPQTFGLPASLRVPIAARDVAAIEAFAGKIVAGLRGRTRPLNAVKVQTGETQLNTSDASLWRQPQASCYQALLFPDHQLWVHVNYDGYRRAWSRLGMPSLPQGAVLDHVANRRSTRERGMLHPWIRLCPVSSKTNSNAGHRRGGEGLEFEFTRWLNSLPAEERAERTKAFATPVVYADPMDLTKMLDIAPGIETLDGVRDFQAFFYNP